MGDPQADIGSGVISNSICMVSWPSQGIASSQEWYLPESRLGGLNGITNIKHPRNVSYLCNSYSWSSSLSCISLSHILKYSAISLYISVFTSNLLEQSKLGSFPDRLSRTFVAYIHVLALFFLVSL